MLFLFKRQVPDVAGRNNLPPAAGLTATLLIALWLLPLGQSPAAAEPPQTEPLPYRSTSPVSYPVIYDNDDLWESGWADLYVMSVASAGTIDLRGMITSNSYGEEGRDPPFSPLPEDRLMHERQQVIEKARRSGMRNLPDCSAGASISLQSRRPASGRIEDTVPIDTPGSRLVVNETRQATPQRPLVLLMGGNGTVAADAYLLDPSIADKMLILWIVGNRRPDGDIEGSSYNGLVDPWATYIIFERLRLIAFAYSAGKYWEEGCASAPQARFADLPDTELRQTLIESWWSGRDPDPDTLPAFSLTRSDHVLETKRYSFSHWYSRQWTGSRAQVQVPYFKQDPNGRVLAVSRTSAEVATDEFWRRVSDEAAGGPSAGQRPFGGAAWPVPGTIEAEHFDYGGTGRAHQDNTSNYSKGHWLNPLNAVSGAAALPSAERPSFRLMENVDLFVSESASGGYKVGFTEAGEWIEYTVDVAREGTYTVEVRSASQGAGGSFHVTFDGIDKTGKLSVPNGRNRSPAPLG